MFTQSTVKTLEQAVRFPSLGADLHGMFHGPLAHARGAVLLCSADGEERVWSHRAQVRLARMLAEREHAVLRFEYVGHGDSAGVYEDATVETRIANTLSAAQLLRTRTGHTAVTLVGARLGAAIALEAASHDSRIESLALWEPIFDIEAYLRNLVRINLTSQMVIHRQVVKTSEQLLEELAAGGRINANGYHLTKEFVDALQTLRPAERLATFRGKVAIFTNPSTRMPESSAEVIRLPFAPFWKEPKMDMTLPTELLARTADWIEANHLVEAK